ncbi:hypothetical protein [Halalkalicoccus tibetensis]|uniref:Enoyl-CoA hydratase/isomerase n=1 Tax=Halalkalicoccus tibetensis TaxID=175632 RepID=A0ABD5V482_9EURY
MEGAKTFGNRHGPVISTESADGIRRVTIDRPERRNALTPAGLDELTWTVRDDRDRETQERREARASGGLVPTISTCCTSSNRPFTTP